MNIPVNTIIKQSSFRIIVMLLTVIVFCAPQLSAHYKLSSFSGDVRVKRAGNIEAAAKDMKIGAFDLIVIGQGSQVTIFDEACSKEYTRSTAGETSLTNLIIEAQKDAGSTLANVHRNVGISKGSAEEGKMYVEKGKVTLALEEYDPAGEETAIDASVLAKYIIAYLSNGSITREFPVPMDCGENNDLHFAIENTSSEPLYINVIKYAREASGKAGFRISELGQPVGCYIMLPGHSITRTSAQGRRNGERHVLVATHYYFSIDELLENLKKENRMEPNEGPRPVPELPIYVSEF